MVVTQKILFITTEEVVQLIGPPEGHVNGNPGFTQEQKDRFVNFTRSYVNEHCNRKLDVVNICGLQLPAGIHATILLLTNETLSTDLGLFLIPMSLLAVSFLLMIFRRWLAAWMASGHDVMIFNVIGKGETAYD